MDSQVFEIFKEAKRQSSTIELIASENHVSSAVTEAVGSCFTIICRRLSWKALLLWM